MLPEMVMAKVEGTTQASLLSSLAGKSYTVGQVTAAGNGLGTWLFLSPEAGSASAGQGAVALKLEGTRQMAQMSGLVGKTVTVGKAPTVVGGVGKWMVLYPSASGLAAGGAASASAGAAAVTAKGLAGSQVLMLKLEGTKFASQVPFMAGKSYTVIKATSAAGANSKWLFLQPVGEASKEIVVLKVHNGAAQLPWLVGKTYTVGNTPLVAGANASKYLILHPATGLAGKTVAATTVAAKGMTAAAPSMKTVALQAAAGGGAGTAAATTGKSLAVATAAKGAATGTIWSGTGLSLGLGLGLGAAGPLILGAVIAATGYGIYRFRKNSAPAEVAADDDLREAIA
ncbi:MAG: magnetosome protein MamD [Alphaproteobacteria bacterium]